MQWVLRSLSKVMPACVQAHLANAGDDMGSYDRTNRLFFYLVIKPWSFIEGIHQRLCLAIIHCPHRGDRTRATANVTTHCPSRYDESLFLGKLPKAFSILS